MRYCTTFVDSILIYSLHWIGLNRAHVHFFIFRYHIWPGDSIVGLFCMIPSGKLTTLLKWPFIVDLPIKMVIFHSYVI